jgi:SAM-dependent methyltransferase
MDRCRLCGQNEMAVILSGIRTDLKDDYSLLECGKCGFVTLSPLPDDQLLGKYYNREYWQEGSNSSSGYMDLLYRLRMSGIVRDIKRVVPSRGRVLDWGAGDGAFVRLLVKNNFSGYGIDSFSPACDGKRIFRSDISDAPFDTESFDCITSFHVLEHLRDPVGAIKSASRLLKPGGVFIAEVPNISSFQYKLFKKDWQPLEIPFHLNHFNPNTLSKLFTCNVNCQVIHVSCFSHRVSPSALLLSVLPSFSPKLVRKRYQGRYPMFLKMAYLFLQAVVYPFVLTEACCKKGAVVRFYVKKTG